jgi:crossover junction endodeoxyribonuclease RuvC
MLILALDTSLNGTGATVLEYKNNSFYVVESHRINNIKLKTHQQKLHRIVKFIEELLIKYDIECCVCEKGFSRYIKATQALYKVVGVVEYITAEYKLTCNYITPTQVKKTITGNGKASKEEVKEGIRNYVNISDATLNEMSNDETDSIAVGVAFILNKGGSV